MLEFYIQSQGPKSHMQVCEMISILGVEILEDSFGLPNLDFYYGKFKVKTTPECLEVFRALENIHVVLTH